MTRPSLALSPLDPDLANLPGLVAWLWIRQALTLGRTARAAAALAHAVADHPCWARSPACLLSHASLALHRGHIAEARAVLAEPFTPEPWTAERVADGPDIRCPPDDAAAPLLDTPSNTTLWHEQHALLAATVALHHGDPAPALALPPGAVEHDLLRAEALLAAGDLRRAAAHAQSLVKRARALQQPVDEARALTLLGRALVDLRDYRSGRVAHEAALALHRISGDLGGVAASTGGLGLCAMGTGSLARGTQLLLQAITACADSEAWAAEAAWRAHLDDALVLLEREEMRADQLVRYVEVVRLLGDAARERTLLQTLAVTRRAVNDRPGAVEAWEALARAHERAGDGSAATAARNERAIDVERTLPTARRSPTPPL